MIEENKLYKRSASYFVFRPAENAFRLIPNYFCNPFEDRSMRNKQATGGLTSKGSGNPLANASGISLGKQGAPMHGLQDFLLNNKANIYLLDNPLPSDQAILIGRMHHSCDEFRKERAQRIAELTQGHETKNISVVLDSNALSTYKNHEYLRNLFSQSIQDTKETSQVKSPENSRISDKKVTPSTAASLSSEEKTPKTFLKSSAKPSLFSHIFHLPYTVNSSELRTAEKTQRNKKGSLEVGEISDLRTTTSKKTCLSASCEINTPNERSSNKHCEIDAGGGFIDADDRMEKRDENEEVHVIMDSLEDYSEKEESFEMRESICVMKSKGIFPNLSSDLFDKYRHELTNSSSFSFNSELIYGNSMCK